MLTLLIKNIVANKGIGNGVYSPDSGMDLLPNLADNANGNCLIWCCESSYSTQDQHTSAQYWEP